MHACPEDPQPYDVPLEGVMLVELAIPDGAEVVAPEGYHVQITITNGAVITGVTVDYQADAQSVWLVPDDLARGVACAWVPIWAVVEFEFLTA